jgi:hypothetical protein
MRTKKGSIKIPDGEHDDGGDGPSDRHGFRGLPPPSSFSLSELADDALLTEYEVASILRFSTVTIASWRQRDKDYLPFLRVAGGRVRYRAGDVRALLARTAPLPVVGRPRKKDAATEPKRKAKSRGTSATTAEIHIQDAVPKRRRTPRPRTAEAAPQDEAPR